MYIYLFIYICFASITNSNDIMNNKYFVCLHEQILIHKS